MSFTRFFILLSILSGSLFAYEPGKWSHINPYVLQGAPGGPKTLKVSDHRGHTKAQAGYAYSADGRLLRETYYSAQGEKEGEARYKYKDGKLLEETLHDRHGKTLTRKLFAYNPRGLSELRIYDDKNRLILHQKFNVRNSQLIAGQGMLEEDRDRFTVKYRGERVESVTITTGSGQLLGRILYKYDEQGRLSERERIQGRSKSRCVYEYDAGGRIASYTYESFAGGKWAKHKTLTLGY